MNYERPWRWKISSEKGHYGKSDMGAQAFRITGIDDAGNPIGLRSDGTRVVIGSADAENRTPRLKNQTPTLVHNMYFFGVLGIDLDADRRIAAAERLQDDFHEGGLEPQLGVSFENLSRGDYSQTPKQARHRKQWNAAIKAVGPRYRNDVIMTVNFNTHAGSLDFVLKGLDRLAKHYEKK